MWAPRSGRSKAYKRWCHDVLDRLADIGYESFEQVLEIEQPDSSALTQLAGAEEKRATRSTDVDESSPGTNGHTASTQN